MIYLDNAATTLRKPPEVERAVLHAIRNGGNAGRGVHSPTLYAARLIYDTRVKLARLFGASDPSRIVFTSNATEALNLAIFGLIGPEDHVITTVCEHNSVLRPLYVLEKRGTQLSFLSGDRNSGELDLEEMRALIRSNTKAVVVTHASNVTGNVTDLHRISVFAKEHSLMLIVDASQSAGTIPIDVDALGIDVLCFTGHKGLFGPQGTGGLYVREGLTIRPQKVGGSGIHSFDREHPNQMPEALEAGTLNVHGIAGLNAGVSYLLKVGVDVIGRQEGQLAERFVSQIQNLPGIRIYGSWGGRERVAVVGINLGDIDSAQLADMLWEEYEICVRAGAHCAPLMHRTLGTEDQGIVRFSFSCFNTDADVDFAVQALKELAVKLL